MTITVTVLIARMLLLTPIILFLLIITLQKLYITAVQIFKACRNNLKLQCTCFRGATLTAETSGQNVSVESQAAARPLIQPTSSCQLWN